ncbi:NAD(P)-dependent oxidoreductase [Lacibacter sediminis]|uniref:SDR family oxidoreductase n=1 Tax=Lacibacter sediminis TaxID=2760713 RepID=A0A7G5XB85_9BACT|nr:SDR family oxidoreductase [Lacibacter sediminis]QNA42738.1 SDR family oxidoreductase [Lacibacter sediminis]
MQLIVFGATGQVGSQLVKQALWRGHSVKAYGRNVYEMDIENDKLEKIKGGLFDAGDILHAVKGCDAVLSAIGGAFDGSDKARSLGMKTIVAQMQKAAVKRIVALGNMSILNFDEHSLIIDQKDYPEEYLPVGNEHRKAYNALKDSPLDWTFVCSPDIINDGPTGNYITARDYPPQPNLNRINAGDLAQFMLNELERNEFVKSRVGISAV